MIDLVLAAVHLEPSPRAVPLGPAMLASALRRAFPDTVRTAVLDLFLQDSAAVCAARILQEEPRWVGFSMYLWNRALILETARLLKASRPELILFAGGAEATADRAGVEADPAMDFVLPGEGEALIVAALGQLLQGVPARELRLGPCPVVDLATLPSPFLDGTLNPADYSGQLWELSRGCPFQCDFCFESRGNPGIRRVPMARVEAELRLFEACQVSQVFVLDPTFNYNRKQAKEVLRLIARTAPDIHFFFEIRSEFLDRELAQLFAAIRCTLQIGLQSASAEVLAHINRTVDLEDFEAKVLLLHQAGATYGFDLIYGLPGDSLAGFQASLDFALSLVPNHLDVFPLSVLPGTRLQETAPGFGLEHQAENPYRVLGSPTFSGAELAQAERLAQSCDVFYNQGRAVPWFGLLTSTLDWAPSRLFAAFADFREGRPGQDLTRLQRDFVASVCPWPGPAAVLEDLVTWFGYSAELEELAQGPAPAAPEPGALPPLCRFATFRHNPLALLEQLEQGCLDPGDLADLLAPQPCAVLLHVREGAVDLAPLTPAQAALLQNLADGKPAPAGALQALLDATGVLCPTDLDQGSR